MDVSLFRGEDQKQKKVGSVVGEGVPAKQTRRLAVIKPHVRQANKKSILFLAPLLGVGSTSFI